MPTWTVANSKKSVPRKNSILGMSLIEILVALTLISLIVVSAAQYLIRDDKDTLGEAVTSLEQALRFSQNESILRNSVVRLKIEPDKNPIEYAVEFGPADAFVLPEFNKVLPDEANLSLKDLEKREALIAGISKKFHRVKEFQDENKELDAKVRILGAATTSRPSFVSDIEVDFYVYPNGEKDGGIIILSTGKEMALIEIEPMVNEVKRTFIAIEAKGEDAITQFEQRKSKELYEAWKRK